MSIETKDSKREKSIWEKMSVVCRDRDYSGQKVCHYSNSTIRAGSLVCSFCCCPIINKVD